MRDIIMLGLFLLCVKDTQGQGHNHTWLIGKHNQVDTNITAPKGRISFTMTTADTTGEWRKMAFYETQGNISNANGNLLAASNGCWIMDATGDTMMNGSGLNPGLYADSWCSATTGMPLPHGNLFVLYPGDSSKLVLFHQAGNFSLNLVSAEMFYSVIDLVLNNGKGGVITGQKNIIAFQDTLSYGMAACKHANGRDWWIVILKDLSNIIYKVLFTPTGIANISTQVLSMPATIYPNAGQPCFSPDGKKFVYTYGKPANPMFQEVRIFSFDRCTGVFDSLSYLYKSNQSGFGLAFSPNSRYLYYSSFGQVFQLDTDAPDIASTDSLIATYDGYCYPFPQTCTNFWLMYHAANGKIYISSSNYVIDLHVINSPDNAGIACNLQQHSLRLPCYSAYGNVNHPNYYLGCDTMQTTCPCLTGMSEHSGHDFKFSVSPNPSNGAFVIKYLLPQNQPGEFSLYDINGRKVYEQRLPQWSTKQEVELSGGSPRAPVTRLKAGSTARLQSGVYFCTIRSGEYFATRKLVIIE